MSLMMLLDMARSGYSSRLAVRDGDIGLSYDDLFRRAGVAAGQIERDGIENLAYIGANSAAFAVALFASAWAGVPMIPVNYRLGEEQIAALLGRHHKVQVIADPLALPLLTRVSHPVVDRSAWMSATVDGEIREDWSSDADKVAVLLYTSGTSAAPKGALLRHRHLLSYVLGSVEFDSASESDAVAVTVPPYHVAGVANLLSNLYAGRRLVYLDSFDAQTWLDTVRREKVTHAMVVPTMLARIVDALGDRPDADVPTLRTLSYGGSRAAPSVIERALQLFPTTSFVNAYGLTETSSSIAILEPEDHRAALVSSDPDVRGRLGSVGRLLPGIEAQIRSADGSHVPVGQVGDLWLRGPQVSGEYLSLASALDEEGWFPTRDRARFDSDGYLFIEGRADDTIIRGGENIAPAEIEELLVRHPAVAEAAVVGLPDVEWGQRIAAVVVPVPGVQVDVDALRRFARERLRTSKTPDQIEIWDSLPYTDTGKLLRRKVLSELSGS